MSAFLSWSPQRRRFRPTMELLEDRRVLAVFPTGFTLDPVVSGLSAGVAFDFAPDGRIFFAEKGGVIQVADNGTLSPFVDVSDAVNSAADRGMLGIAVHPDFPQQPYVYAAYTHDPASVTQDAGHSRVARVTRFTADPGTNYATAVPGSEVILVGNHSTLANIPEPDVRNPENPACGPIDAYVQDCIPSDELSHTIGAVRFAQDGSLLVASGDGGRYTGAQHYNVRSIDPDSLAGKILRIDPLNGQGYADNPFFDGNPDSNRSKVYSLGLRNPFRFAVDPASGEPFIGDVGWNSWEEINRGSGNFGWPCFEGGDGVLIQQGSYIDFPECQALQAAGTAQAAIHAYPHSTGNSSVQVGDFYAGTTYPAEYHDALFFLDFDAQTIWSMTLDAQRQPLSVTSFATEIGSIVQVSRGLDTNLYVLDIYRGTLERLRYTAGGNSPPTALASATQVTATTYDFSSQGSYDPDADPLDFFWDFGDGLTSIEPHPTHTFSGSGPVVVTLTVSDPAGADGTDTVEVIVDNLLPTVEILSPTQGDPYLVEDTIVLSGSATDPEDGALTGSSLEWHVGIHHNDHAHLDLFQGTGETASFQAVDHEDNSYFEICLTATDSLGGQDVQCIDVFPTEVDYTFQSIPSGLTLNYSGSDFTTPFTVTTPVNAVRTITAPLLQGEMEFVAWSDQGDPSHDIQIGSADSTLTATYQMSGTSVIVVRAQGDTGEELIELQLDGVAVATFALSNAMTDFEYIAGTAVSADQVRVAFINDQSAPVDRGVRVDHIAIDGVTYETEHPSVLSTGTWNGSCDPGFKRSERLDCDGYFQYDDAIMPPDPDGSVIVVRALGEEAQEMIELQIDQIPVATFSLTASMQDFSYTHDQLVTPGQVRVAFVNDFRNPPIDRNVVVDHIVIDGVTYETEDPSVLSTGTWDGSCDPGLKQSERLDCGGYFQYDDVNPPDPEGSVIVVRALGEEAQEVIELRIDQIAVATFSLTASMQDFSYTHDQAVTPNQVRVAFINDLWNPPVDRNVVVDHILIDGVIYETEDPSVLSTGTWDGSCDPGLKQSERLDCGGYFEYGQSAAAAVVAANPKVPLPQSRDLLGDINEDGDVDFRDFLVLAEDFGKVTGGDHNSDLNGDGAVEFDDFLILLANFGQSTDDDGAAEEAAELARDQMFARYPLP